MYQYVYPVPCTSTMYQYLVPCTSTLYMYLVPSISTRTKYLYQSTRTRIIPHLITYFWGCPGNLGVVRAYFGGFWGSFGPKIGKMPGILRRTRVYLEITLRPPGYFVDSLNFASDFAPDQLSDSGKLESWQNEGGRRGR